VQREKDGNEQDTSQRLQIKRLNCWKRLRVAAYVALSVHFVAGLAMALVLRRGLETAEFGTRITFLAESRSLWIAAWCCWNLAALSILFFYATFVDAHKRGGRSIEWLLQFALFISVVAVAVDLTAESIEMGVMPDLAQKIVRNALALSAAVPLPVTISLKTAGSDLFVALNRAVVMMTGYLANGLYTVSAASLLVATRREYNHWALAAGCLVVIGGIWLSFASLLNSVTGMLLSNILLLPALLLWLAAVAGTCRKRIAECGSSNSVAVNTNA
jgi:hypothetical protein